MTVYILNSPQGGNEANRLHRTSRLPPGKTLPAERDQLKATTLKGLFGSDRNTHVEENI